MPLPETPFRRRPLVVGSGSLCPLLPAVRSSGSAHLSFQLSPLPHASFLPKKGRVACHPAWPSLISTLPSADRRGVLKPALGPEPVQATCDLERRALPDVLLEDLAIVPDMLDDAIGPVLGQSELLAVVPFSAEQALDVRVGRLHRLVHGRL